MSKKLIVNGDIECYNIKSQTTDNLTTIANNTKSYIGTITFDIKAAQNSDPVGVVYPKYGSKDETIIMNILYNKPDGETLWPISAETWLCNNISTTSSYVYYIYINFIENNTNFNYPEFIKISNLTGSQVFMAPCTNIHKTIGGKEYIEYSDYGSDFKFYPSHKLKIEFIYSPNNYYEQN